MVKKVIDQRSTVNRWIYGIFCTGLLSSIVVSLAVAGPDGGQVIGGAGFIVHSGNTTTINQSTQNMAIDWQSYNVNANERVQYIQPNSSSISLNRILSQNGSTIAGRIDANGQVILVNPNGIFFTPTSIINVGGIIASGLNIQPTDFMNGNYIFDEVMGTDGTVINSGMINASLGGNVALIGKQVKNDGLIVANLGTVNLAAGKQAVLTFDQGGLLGVRVSEEILQEELGVDPAVLNSGEINAEGGRVLLTASTSQDVFSQAVNTGDLNQSLSVVMHEDGSFTLGNGADVLNTGIVDTSTSNHDQNTGRIVLLGENVTSSGELLADAKNGNGGEIELHAQNTTLLTANSVTSARSETNGQGGGVKVLGDRVGLFDQSTVDVSGTNGGGKILIGGAYRGENPGIRNASVTYVSRDSQLYADALIAGDGGNIIHWADDSTFFYGSAFAKGGVESGNGGLVEVSGKSYLDYGGNVNTTALKGETGVLLLDPTDITILDGTGDTAPDGDSSNNGFNGCPTTASACFSDGVYGQVLSGYTGPTEIYESELEGISATTNIILEATNNITINNLVDDVLLLSTESGHSVTFVADADNSGAGDFLMSTGDSITTQGGAVSISAADISVGNINTTGERENAGGNITLTATTGTVNAQSLTAIGGLGNNSIGSAAGNVTVSADGQVVIGSNISAIGGQGERDGSISYGGGEGGIVSVTSTTSTVSVQGVVSNGGEAHGTGSSAPGGIAGTITLTGNGIVLNQDISAVGGALVQGGNQGNGNTITFNGPVTLANNAITIDAQGTDRGAINFTGTLDGTENLALYGGGVDFSGLVGSGTRLGDLFIDATGAINAGTNSIAANSLVVTQSTGFISGDINTTSADNSDTDGGQISITANTTDAENTIAIGNIDTSAGTRETDDTGNAGGAVNLTGRAITVGSINTSGGTAPGTDNNGGAAGTLQINAREGSGTETTPSITLNDDINATGGTSTGNGNQGTPQVAALMLNSTTTATVTIGHDTDFTSVVTLTGSDGTDTLNAANRPNDWVLTSTDSTLNTDLTFSSIEILVGNVQNDRFTLPGSGEFTGTLYGRGGTNDEMQAGNRLNDWDISSAGIGTMTGLSGTFNEIESLIGGNAADTFEFTGGSITGTAEGRAGDDTFTITQAITQGQLDGGADSDTFRINANVSGDSQLRGGAGNDRFDIANGISIATTLTGEIAVLGGADTDTLDLADVAQDLNWNITTSTGGGNITDTASTPFTIAAFDEMENLIGSDTRIDTFRFDTGGLLSGDINAGGGADVFNFNGGTLTSTAYGEAGTDFFNINTISPFTVSLNGGNDTDTVRGPDVANTWQVTADGGGTLNSTIAFSQMETLTGGTGTEIDTFTVDSGFSIDTLNGQDGGDQFTINGSVGSVNAGNGSNTVSVPGTVTDAIITGTGGDTITVTGAVASINAGDDINIVTVNNGGSVTGAITTGTGNDTIVLADTGIGSAGSISAGNGTNTVTINTGGNVAGAITTGVNNDTITVAGTVTTIDASDGFNNIDISGTATTITTGTGIDTITVSGDVTSIATGASDDGITVSGTVSDVINGGTGSGDVLDITTAGNQIVQLGGTDTGTENFTVNNVETIDATNSATGNTLRAENGPNTWDINTANSGEVTGITFINFANLSGGTGNDTFTISAALSSITTGDGPTSTNTITINSGGAVSGAIIGGDGIDDITVNTGGSTGSVSTGANTDSVWLASTGVTTGPLAGGSEADTLTVNTTGNIWALTNATDGTVSNGNTISFTGFESLNSEAGSSLDFSNVEDNIAIDLNTFTGFGSIIGNYTNGGTYTASITGQDGTTNNWLIGEVTINATTTDGLNDGTVTNGTTTLTFENFNALTGGDGNDTFTITSGTGPGPVNGAFDGTINGAGGNNTLIARDVDNIWTINETDSTLAYNTSVISTFNAIRNVTGGSLADTFTVNADVTNINTGNGNNSITVNSGGSVTEAITGGTGIDTINIIGSVNTLGTGENDDVITVSGTVSGVIDGGSNANDNDTLTINASGDRIVQLGTVASASADYTVTNIELIDADTTTDNTLGNTLRGATDNNIWQIDADNDGDINGTAFRNFANLEGNTGNDTFTVDAALRSITTGNGGNSIVINSGGNVTGAITGGTGIDTINIIGSANTLSTGESDDSITVSGTVSGVIDGGSNANDNDTLTINASGDRIVQLGTVASASADYTVTNIELIDADTTTGNTLGNTLRGATDNNIWQIDADNDGDINGTAFRNFANLEGNTGNDTFTVDAVLRSITTGNGGNSVAINSSGNVTGAITGGTGIDTINIMGSANTLSTGESDDSITVSGTVSGVIDGGSNANDTLTISASGDRIVQLGTVASASADYTVTNIELIDADTTTGNTLGNTLRGATDNNIWQIDADNDGDINSTAFRNFANLEGSTGNDTFTVDATLRSITTGNGNNSITVNNDGNVTEAIIGGTGIDTINIIGSANTLNTGENNDIIIVSGTVSGVIDGGSNAGDNDTLTISASGDRIVQLGNIASASANYTVTNIELIDADTTTGNILGNTLRGATGNNIWQVDADNDNDGSVNGTAFRNFANLEGSTGNDTFTVDAALRSITTGNGNNSIVVNSGGRVTGAITGGTGIDSINIIGNANTLSTGENDDIITVSGTVSGLIDGGTNTDDNDRLFIAATGDRTVQLGTNEGAEDYTVTNVERIDADGTTGNTTGNILQADAGANTWTINDVNDGRVDNVDFTNFANLVGNNGVDTFDVSADISGVIDGGGAQDILTITTASAQIVQLSATDLDAGENLNVTRVETINASNSDVDNTLRADTGANTWEVDVDNGGRIINSGSTIGFTNFTRLEGNAGVDSFTVDAQINSINAGEGVNGIIVGNTGNMTGSLITGTNNDTINVAGTVNLIIAGEGSNNINISGSAASITSGNGNDIYNISGNASSINAGDGANDITITTTGNISGALVTGAGNDIINIAGIVDGVISGGAGGDDTLTITTAGDQVIQLGAIDSGTENFTVNNVETIDVTNLATNNVLRAGEGRNVWFVNTDNDGTVRDLDTGATITFSNVANLVGNSNADTFNVNAAITSINAGAGTNSVIVNGNITGTLMTGTGNDTININAGGTATSINVGNGTNSITVAGSATGLTGGTGIDTITVTGSVNTINTDDGNDDINISGTVAGVIDGGNGIADLLTITRAGDQTVQLGSTEVGDENYTVTNVETIDAANTSNNTLGNTLIADAGPNSWTINGNNSGFVTDDESTATTAFSGFSSLTGSNANDTFTISNPGGNIDGLINGMGGNDSLNITMPEDMIVQLGNRVDENVLNVFQVEEITANSAYINTLRGDNAADSASPIDYNWTIADNNSGAVSYNGETTVFTNFSNLYGGTAVDQFTVTAGSLDLIDMGEGNDFFSISGGIITTVDGNAGNDTFTFSGGTVTNLIGGDGTDFIVDTSPVVNITVGSDIGGFEGITAQNGNGTINAQDGVLSDWIIDGTNAGRVSDSSGEDLAFSGFSTINGGSGVDDFLVNANGSVSGTVSGNGDNDTLSIDLPDNTIRTSSGQINFEGSSGDDVITITGASGIYAETYNPRTQNYDQLAYDNGNGITFDINYQGTETVNDNIETTRLTINSTGNTDIIELGTTVFGTTTGAVNVNYVAGSKNNISLLALNGSDVNLSSNVMINGDLTIMADEINQADLSTITASLLTLENVNQAGTPDNALTTNVNGLAIIDHSGSLFIDEQNDITLTNISGTTGSIDITAAGSIISTTDLQSSSMLSLDAMNSIDLSGQNRFSGATTFIATDGSIVLGGANTFFDTVSMTTGNDITVTENIVAVSPVILSAGNNINLSAANNQLDSELTLSGATVNINNTVATTLASVTAENLTIDSTGDITSTGAIRVQNDGMTGETTLSSEGSIILNNESNNLERVSLTAANDVTLTESDGIILANATAGGVLNVTANNGLTANDAAIGDMGLGNITATSINLDASEGAIVDQSSRLTADIVTLAAASGIGDDTAINTVTSTLSVVNASFENTDTTPGMATVNTAMTSGIINITNTGNVTIDDLRNYGDIRVTNVGNITLSITDNRGAIDANYGGNMSDFVYAGDVTITGTRGNNFSTMGVGTLSGNADITAENLYVENISRFGTQASPIGLRVNNNFTLFADQGAIYYLGSRPRNVITTADLLQLAIQGFTGISSQQLIDIETLGEIDQAIFTEVRNYNYDDVAILLPADQRYGNDDEEEENGQNGE